MSSQFKIVLVGDGGVGKTCWVKQLLTGELERKYIATVGVEAHVVSLNTSAGVIEFHVWDCAGQDTFGAHRDGYYVGAKAAVIFFDVTSRSTYMHVPAWYRDLVRVLDSVPIVLVGNKVDDVANRKVKSRDITFHRKKNLQYFEISLARQFDTMQPLLHLARQLKRDASLALVDHSAMPKAVSSAPPPVAAASSASPPPPAAPERLVSSLTMLARRQPADVVVHAAAIALQLYAVDRDAAELADSATRIDALGQAVYGVHWSALGGSM